VSEPRVVVLTTPGCHLCEDACGVVAAVADECGVEWRARDVGEDDELRVRWRDYVPVILVDGEVHDWFRVDADRLRAALR
jgi:glutaredoxin